MKAGINVILGIVILAVAAVPGALAQEDYEVYGEPLTGSETVEISELLSNPGPYLDKVVRVKGVVSDVSKTDGSWVTIASKNDDSQEIRINGTDGMVAFPRKARGRTATAEGVFTKIEMTLQQTIQHRRLQAEEQGAEFDPASVTEPLVIYQIRGTGVVVR